MEITFRMRTGVNAVRIMILAWVRSDAVRGRHCQKALDANPGASTVPSFRLSQAEKRVDPTRLELVASAVQSQVLWFTGVRRRSQTPITKPFS